MLCSLCIEENKYIKGKCITRSQTLVMDPRQNPAFEQFSWNLVLFSVAEISMCSPNLTLQVILLPSKFTKRKLITSEKCSSANRVTVFTQVFSSVTLRCRKENQFVMGENKMLIFIKGLVYSVDSGGYSQIPKMDLAAFEISL